MDYMCPEKAQLVVDEAPPPGPPNPIDPIGRNLSGLGTIINPYQLQCFLPA